MRSAVHASLVLFAALAIIVGGCPAPTGGNSNSNTTPNSNNGTDDGGSTNSNGTTEFIGNSSGPGSGSDAPAGGGGGTNTNAAGTNSNLNAAGDANSNQNASANANANDNSTGGNANQNTNSDSTSGNANDNTNVNTNAPPPASALAGRWQATIGCTSTQSISGVPAAPNPESITLEITFDADGELVSLTVVNFANGIDQVALLTNVNDVATLTADSGGLDANLVARLTQIGYDGGGAQINLTMHYIGQQGSLFQNGNGMQVLTVSPSGGALAYSLDVTYNVNQQTGSLVLQTGEVIECDGVLTLVP